MIAQTLVISFVFFAITYLIRSCLTVTTKKKGILNPVPGPNFPASSLPAGAKDLSFWGTLKLAWKSGVVVHVFWDGTPPYAKAFDILQQYKSTFVRLFYLTNWKSASRIVLCSDLETIKEAFRSSTWLDRFHHDHYIYMIASFGKPLGILLGSGPYWKTARKVVVTGFRDHGILEATRIEELFSEEIQLVLNGLQDRIKESSMAHAAVFSPKHMFDNATLNVIFKILFSRKVSETDPFEKGLAERMSYNNENVNFGFTLADLFPFFTKYLWPLVKSARENNERGRRTKSVSNCHRDLMDSFLEQVKVHEGSLPNYFTFENLQATIRDLIMAGSDTIQVTLEHLLLYIASNTKDQKKVQEEIDRVIGPARFPTYEDRKSMIYTQAVIQETWRLGSITPVSHRMNNKDCQLGGMDIKKGTYLVPLYLGANHSPQLWKDPSLFKPSRFISETTGQIANTEKMLTFSYGPRACPGELAGRVAVFLFTVVLLREFEWELSDMHPQPSSFHGGLTRTCAKYFVKIRHRQNRV